MTSRVVRAQAVVIWREYFPRFEYLRPKTLDEALELLEKFGEEAKVKAGGTCLTRKLRARKVVPKYVIDITGIKELRRIEYHEGKELVIGATVTHEDIVNNKLVKDKFTALWEASASIGDVETRARGTVGGNIANSSAQADIPPALMIFNSYVTLLSKSGKRQVKLTEFFTGHKKNVMKPNELLVSIHVPEPPDGAKSSYLKFKRSIEDRALVGIAALVANPRDPSKRVIRLAYTAIAKTPVYLKEAEEIFKRDKPLNELVEEVIKIAQSKFDLPVGERGIDLRTSDDYRLHLIRIGTKAILKYLIEGVRVI